MIVGFFWVNCSFEASSLCDTRVTRGELQLLVYHLISQLTGNELATVLILSQMKVPHFFLRI